ncbi:MAG: ADP-ribosylglycohydrolase family protein [Lachnospiraceae bacterium]|nr:ADP-ribosylglycohydrolase family protein [Lachnospiraceae bacterium]
MTELDRIRGCLIGGAAGDALGYEVEFMREKEIFGRFGSSGITEYALYEGKALISDDTQMTLFTAMGLIAAAREVCEDRTVFHYIRHIIPCYQDWYQTQNGYYPAKPKEKANYLMEVEELYARRAPGITCLNAISQGCDGCPEEPINQSKGCGGIMRVAPVALLAYKEGFGARQVDELAARAAALTHGHPLGYLSAAAFVHIVYRIMQGDSVREAIADSIREITAIDWGCPEYAQQTAQVMEKALQLADARMDDLEAIHALGEGWVAEETLAIAVYCAAKYPDDLDKCLIAAVNHKGDSDSTGAVAGNIVGAAIGYERIPDKYIRDLELKECILKIADDLAADCETL